MHCQSRFLRRDCHGQARIDSSADSAILGESSFKLSLLLCRDMWPKTSPFSPFLFISSTDQLVCTREYCKQTTASVGVKGSKQQRQFSLLCYAIQLSNSNSRARYMSSVSIQVGTWQGGSQERCEYLSLLPQQQWQWLNSPRY
jgi:hypothetical protein